MNKPPIVVALNPSFLAISASSNEEKMRQMEEASKYVRQQFIRWLAESSPDFDCEADIGPSGWQDYLVPVITVEDRNGLGEILMDESRRPPFVRSVSVAPIVQVD